MDGGVELMANPARGVIEFEARGQTYRLRFSNNALAELEQALGEPLGRFAPRLQHGEIGVRDIRAMLWAGIRGADPKASLSLEEVGELMDELGLPQAATLAAQAFAAAFPASDEGAQGNA